jgi:hypothetical protein
MKNPKIGDGGSIPCVHGSWIKLVPDNAEGFGEKFLPRANLNKNLPPIDAACGRACFVLQRQAPVGVVLPVVEKTAAIVEKTLPRLSTYE